MSMCLAQGWANILTKGGEYKQLCFVDVGFSSKHTRMKKMLSHFHYEEYVFWGVDI